MYRAGRTKTPNCLFAGSERKWNCFVTCTIPDVPLDLLVTSEHEPNFGQSNQKEKIAMKKRKCILLGSLALLVGFVAYVALAFFGNPVSYLLAKRGAENYLAERYADIDYRIERVSYHPKTKGYNVFVLSPSSEDSYFSIYLDLLGHVRYDDSDHVTSGWNTWLRLEQEYQALTGAVFASSSFGYTSDLCFGSIATLDEYKEERWYHPGEPYGIHFKDLELDEAYDIREIASRVGVLTLYVQGETLTFDRAAEILLDVKEMFDQANVPFYAIDFVMQQGKLPNGEEINVDGFRYDDITREGLAERIQIAHEQLSAWYVDEDK